MSQEPISPETISELQRLFYDENLSKAEVARRLNISPTTVYKYVPVRAGLSQRCSNKEAAEHHLVKSLPSKKSKPDTAIGEKFAAPKPSKGSKVLAPSLPEPVKRDTSAFELNIPGNWWVLSDIHFPFHDKQALELGAERAKKEGVVGILLNGDTIDGLGLSSKFHKRPDEHMFEQELECWYAFATWLRHQFPKIPIIYKRGNHEERFEVYLAKFPEFFGIKHIQFQNVMEFEKHGVTDVKDGRVIMLGKLPVLHGHEYQSGISAPVNPARGAFLRLTHTVLVGHSHQSSDHNEKNMFDKVISVWSTGCNCTLKPRYKPFNKWNHGCAIVNVGKGGDFEVKNYKVIEGVLR